MKYIFIVLFSLSSLYTMDTVLVLELTGNCLVKEIEKNRNWNIGNFFEQLHVKKSPMNNEESSPIDIDYFKETGLFPNQETDYNALYDAYLCISIIKKIGVLSHLLHTKMKATYKDILIEHLNDSYYTAERSYMRGFVTFTAWFTYRKEVEHYTWDEQENNIFVIIRDLTATCLTQKNYSKDISVFEAFLSSYVIFSNKQNSNISDDATIDLAHFLKRIPHNSFQKNIFHSLLVILQQITRLKKDNCYTITLQKPHNSNFSQSSIQKINAMGMVVEIEKELNEYSIKVSLLPAASTASNETKI